MGKKYYLYEREISGERKLYTSKEKALIQAIWDYAKGVKEEIMYGSNDNKDTIPSSVIFDICDLFEWGSTFEEGEDPMCIVEVPVVEEEDD